MTLAPGTKLGPYEIAALVGAGGMGEVYRARDTRLDRDVAIKILPELFVADVERLARFEREAKTLASLNHPNIAQIYGIESSNLIMELVDGEDLSTRIARGPIPLAEALQIAKQIADALEAAHDRGIIHRDLKPANIKLAADGTVKVLDFGLAKAVDSSAASADPQNSPTMAMTGTLAGVILGTAAYMAPEQARGQAADRRVDIWAFGVVLFEMLSGKQAFSGETISDVLASVLKNDLQWNTLPADLPAPIVALLKRCLNPDRKNRMRDIGEARIAIAEYLAAPARAAADTSSTPRALRRWQAAAAGLAIIAVAAMAIAALKEKAAPAAPMRFVVSPPDDVSVHVGVWPAVSLSPDGSHLVFAGDDHGTAKLYLRRPGDFEPRVMPGTEGGTDPVFSPDGRTIAFTAERLKTITLEGAITDVGPVNDPRGITWLDNTTLAYTPASIGGIIEVSLNGGASRPISTIDEKAGERSHRWPHALPGGEWVLFTVGLTSNPDNYDDAHIDAVNRRTGERRAVFQGASMARYGPSGHLIYARKESLFAVPFDVKSLKVTGIAMTVVPGLSGDMTTGAVHVAWSNDGTLAYVPIDRRGGLRRLTITDRKGARQAIDQLAPALYNDVRLSPDGTRAAVIVGTSGLADIWVYTFARGTFTRLTSTSTNATPIWSKDGRDVYFVSFNQNGRDTTVFRTNADGGRDPVKLLSIPVRFILKDLSKDESWALIDYATFGPMRANVGRLPLKPDAGIQAVVNTSSEEYGAALSPDERYVAYQSNETGQPEIYVRELGTAGGRRQISNSGGEEPTWSRDGRTLFFRTGVKLMSAPIERASVFSAGTPVQLFEGIYNLRSETGISYDPHPDGARFLMVREAEGASSGSVRLVTRGFDELKGRKP